MVKNKKFISQEDFLKSLIPLFKNEMPHSCDKDYKTIPSNSSFNINKYDVNSVDNNIKFTSDKYKKPTVRCDTKVKLKLNKEQRDIINLWFDACTEMYNICINYIKTNHPNLACGKIADKKLLKSTGDDKILKGYNFQSLFKKEFEDIQQKYKYTKTTKIIKKLKRSTKVIIKTTNITMYNETLRRIPQLVVTNLKSIQSNFLNNHIKRVRLSEWKSDRNCKMMEFSKRSYRDDGMMHLKLGNLKSYNYKTIPAPLHDFNLCHNTKTGEYILNIPTDIDYSKIKSPDSKSNVISLDPGVRTFMSGLGNKEFIELGQNICHGRKLGKNSINFDKDEKPVKKQYTYKPKEKFKNIVDKDGMTKKEYNKKRKEYYKKKYKNHNNKNNYNRNDIMSILERIKDINKNPHIPDKVKSKCTMKLYTIIKNRVDDMHWKIIKYLTNNYKNVLLGNMSSKSIVKKKTSVLSGQAKQLVMMLGYYKFKQRLQYKCKINDVNFKYVNESYTSKICSMCGWKNDNLKGNKTFSCEECKYVIDRDYNGCRNIGKTFSLR